MTATSIVSRVVRGFLLLVGLLVFVVGLSAGFVPGVEGVLPVAAAVDALGSDYLVVAAVGVGAVGLSILVVAVQSVRGVDESQPPVVESVETAPHPGRDLDRSFGGLSGVTSADATRARLADLTVETVMRAEGCPRSTAERRIREGSWTDDPVAAAFVAGDGGDTGARLQALLGVDDRVRRTVAAVERTAADERGGSSGPGRDGGSEVP